MSLGVDSYIAQQAFFILPNPVTTWKEHAEHAEHAYDRVLLRNPPAVSSCGVQGWKTVRTEGFFRRRTLEALRVQNWEGCFAHVVRM